MTEEIMQADVYAGNDFMGSVKLMFQVQDGQVTGLRFGNISLDADAAKAILEEVLLKTHSSDHHGH